MTEQRIEEIIANLSLTAIAKGKTKEDAVKEAKETVLLMAQATQEIQSELQK